MASRLMRSSPDRSDPVLNPGACFSKVPGEKFSQPESRGIISKLIVITELFYLHILSITRSSLHTRLSRNVPLVGHTVVFLGKVLYSHCAFLHPGVQSLSFRFILPRRGTSASREMVTGELLGNLKNCGEMTCDGLASRPRGVEILLAASCHRNRDKLWQLRTSPSGSKASLLFG